MNNMNLVNEIIARQNSEIRAEFVGDSETLVVTLATSEPCKLRDGSKGYRRTWGDPMTVAGYPLRENVLCALTIKQWKP